MGKYIFVVILSLINYLGFFRLNENVFKELSSTHVLKSLNGKPGVSVKAISSDALGNYSPCVLSGEKVRLIIGDASRQASSASTRFVKSPQSNVNFNVGDPEHYVPDSAYIASPIYIQGSGNTTASALVAQPLAGGSPISLATAAQVGSLWGVAFEASSQQLYSSAFAKRHVGYGPLGPGGIYRTDWKTRKTVPFIDLASLGIPVGNDHHDSLTADLLAKSLDAGLMADVGTMSIGGIEVFEGKLYVMNLSNQTLYAITLPKDVSQAPTASDVTAYPVPNSGCTGGIARPFAVKAHQGKIYVGVVCDASTSQLTSNLKAFVYALDIGKSSFKEVLNLPLDYQRGEAVKGLNVKTWYGWADDFSKALHTSLPSTAARPQPILSSLAFDQEGNLILGFMDRFGHQSGTGQPDPKGLSSYSAVAAGDVLKVYAKNPEKSKVNYQLEANARAGQWQSEGIANAQGPKGGEFYFEDGFKGLGDEALHEETGAGAVLTLANTDEVLMTAHEPAQQFNTSGIKALSNREGKATRGWDLYSNGELGTFGKANGVGGLALVGEAAPITVGDRLWIDANGDGVQDVNEMPLANVEVELYREGQKVSSTRSDAEGLYSFTGLKAQTAYEIRVALAQQSLKLSKTKATSQEELDNDGVEENGYAVIRLETKGVGESSFHYDLGFLCTSKPSFTSRWVADKKSGESHLLLSSFESTHRYEWSEGEEFTGSGDVEQAKLVPENGLIFTNHGATANKAYVLRVMDEKGCYQQQAFMTPAIGSYEPIKSDQDFVVYPNPVVDQVNVRLKARSEKAKLTVMSLQGQVLLQTEIQSKNDSYYVSIKPQHLPKGMYLLSIQEKEVIRTSSFTKE